MNLGNLIKFSIFDGLHLALRAYCDDKPNDEWLQVKAKNETAVVRINDFSIDIGVAGSNDFKDWFDNFRIIGTTRSGYGRVPRGFYTNLDRLAPKIMELIKDHRDKTVTISGHSRGGAIAFLLAIFLHRQGFRITDIVTFGCPNVGKSNFIREVKRIKANIRMYKNGSDLITTLPPFIFGYKKPSRQIQIGKKRWWGTSIEDHYRESYSRVIQKIES
jgi:hypothetical protein